MDRLAVSIVALYALALGLLGGGMLVETEQIRGWVNACGFVASACATQAGRGQGVQASGVEPVLPDNHPVQLDVHLGVRKRKQLLETLADCGITLLRLERD